MEAKNKIMLLVFIIFIIIINNVQSMNNNETLDITNFTFLSSGLYNLSLTMQDNQNVYQPSIVVERYYTINLPTGFNKSLNNSYDLIIHFHGAGGVAYSKAIKSGFTRLSNEDGFIVVYPQSMGIQKSNEGNIEIIFENDTAHGNNNTCWNQQKDDEPEDKCYAKRRRPEDDKFINIIINNITTQLNISRILVSGFSNGCGYAQHLAMTRLDIGGVAVGGCRVPGLDFLNYNESTSNGSRKPLPIIRTHVTNDTIIPYHYLNHTLNETEQLPTAELATYFFAIANNCSTNASIEYNIGLGNLQGVSQIDHWIYENCTNNASVEFYKLQDGTHKWYSNFAIVFWNFLDNYGIYDEIEQPENPTEDPNPPGSSSPSGGGGSGSSNNENFQEIKTINITEENITEEIILEFTNNKTTEEVNISNPNGLSAITGFVVDNLQIKGSIFVLALILLGIFFYFIKRKYS